MTTVTKVSLLNIYGFHNLTVLFYSNQQIIFQREYNTTIHFITGAPLLYLIMGGLLLILNKNMQS